MADSAVRVEHSPASLLPPAAAAPSPPPEPGAVVLEAPPPAYSDAWVRKLIVYVLNAAAEEWGPEMRATEIELGLLAPPLAALLNQHAPSVMAGGDPQASAVFLAGVVVLMGARRGLAIRRRRRAGAATGTRARITPPPAPAPPPAPLTSPNGGPGGAFGRGPVTSGGMLGDGRRLA